MEHDNSPTNIGYVTGLACLGCKTLYTLPELIEQSGTIFQNGCDECWAPLDVRYDYQEIGKVLTPAEIKLRRRTTSVAMELLPFNDLIVEDLPWTPLRRAHELERKIKYAHGVSLEVYLKLDTELPTGSFKDRPTMASFNKALEDGGYRAAITSSTGNLAVSVLYHAQKYNFAGLLFIPEILGGDKVEAMEKYANLPTRTLSATEQESFPDKVVEQLLHSAGRQVIRLDATYDEANRYANSVAENANKMARQTEGRNVVLIPNDTFRPFYKEGSKTQGIETILQMQLEHDVKEGILHVITPIGSGALACSGYKGMKELQHLGLTELEPRVYAAQAAGCSPLVDALINEEPAIKPVKTPETIAKSIAIGDPGSGYQLLEIVRKSGGGGLKVSEEEVFNRTVDLLDFEGVLSQYVGGVTLGALHQGIRQSSFGTGDRVVLNITGTGERIRDELMQGAERFGQKDRVQTLLLKR